MVGLEFGTLVHILKNAQTNPRHLRKLWQKYRDFPHGWPNHHFGLKSYSWLIKFPKKDTKTGSAAQRHLRPSSNCRCFPLANNLWRWFNPRLQVALKIALEVTTKWVGFWNRPVSQAFKAGGVWGGSFQSWINLLNVLKTMPLVQVSTLRGHLTLISEIFKAQTAQHLVLMKMKELG